MKLFLLAKAGVVFFVMAALCFCSRPKLLTEEYRLVSVAPATGLHPADFKYGLYDTIISQIRFFGSDSIVYISQRWRHELDEAGNLNASKKVSYEFTNDLRKKVGTLTDSHKGFFRQPVNIDSFYARQPFGSLHLDAMFAQSFSRIEAETPDKLYRKYFLQSKVDTLQKASAEFFFDKNYTDRRYRLADSLERRVNKDLVHARVTNFPRQFEGYDYDLKDSLRWEYFLEKISQKK